MPGEVRKGIEANQEPHARAAICSVPPLSVSEAGRWEADAVVVADA